MLSGSLSKSTNDSFLVVLQDALREFNVEYNCKAALGLGLYGAEFSLSVLEDVASEASGHAFILNFNLGLRRDYLRRY